MNHSSRLYHAPIAIIGMGCLFPEAPGLNAYWRLLFRKQDAIRDIPKTHWSAQDYFDPNPKTPDHVYCKRGAFLSSLPFDPSEFGIPPASLEATDTSQLLALVTAKAALEDAGYGSDAEFNRDKTSVILGVTGTQELVIPLGARLGHPLWRRALKNAGVSNDIAEKVIADIADGYVPWQENSFPGLLGNVVAGRICNRLNLGGTNCVVDAACASSMGALHLALLELQSGRSDMVVSGGVDTINDIFMHMCFARTMILSPTGDIRPFSKDADGTLLGEGIGMVVLKRLQDAEKDGDRIYAVIKGMGSSSDGRSQSIYAPRAEGQAKALQMAYDKAGIDPATIGMIEAHGTGTRVGDQVEFSSLKQVVGKDAAAGNRCAVGSVKSMIGHTKAAAGAAGLIKAALALKNKVLPPTLKADQPDPKLGIDQSPFYINTESRPWFSRPDHPRRSGVSAFGFGGSNFHVVLEEHCQRKETVSWDESFEIVAFSADQPEALINQILEFKNRLGDHSSDRRRLAAASRRRFNVERPCRLVMVHEQTANPSKPAPSLGGMLDQAVSGLRRNHDRATWREDGIYYGSRLSEPGRLAFIFPGQGSQYVGMGKDLACIFPDTINLLDAINQRTQPDQPRLSDRIYPIHTSPAEEKAGEALLRRTEIAQPAIGAISLSMLNILKRFGVAAVATCGHSYGELTALYAAGWMDQDTFIDLSMARGRIMAEAAGQGDNGAMLAVKAPVRELAAFCSSRSGLTLANLNSPEQGVLSGPSDRVEDAQAELKQMGFRSIRLPVSAAFHTPMQQTAADRFRQTLKSCDFTPGATAVMSNATGSVYPKDASLLKKILGDQIIQPVQFISNIEHLYDMGVQTFVEIGPKTVLTGLIRTILGKRTHHAVAMDASAGKRFGLGDLAGTLSLLASLGHPVQLQQWGDPVPETRKQRMQVPLSGANYRSPGKKPANRTTTPKSQADAANPSNQTGGRPMQNPTADARAEQGKRMGPKTPAKRNPTPRLTQSTKPEIMKHNPQSRHSQTVMENAIRTVQEGLAAMQSLQARTAEAHQKFLETQTEASRALQRMMESTQRMAEASLGIGSPLPAPETETPAWTGPSVAPADLHPAPLKQATASTEPAAMDDPAEHLEPPPVSSVLPIPQATPAVSARMAEKPPRAPGIQNLLLDVVAELTGYPVEMLDTGMDIEADLGIDSIKRVEILSTLEERMPALPTVSPDMMGTLKTLGQIVDYLTDPPQTEGGPVAVSSTATPVSGPSPAESPGAVTTGLEAILLDVVAELTGYPVEMLDTGMDIEADLGIDSIKRVEILSTLEERMPTLPTVSPDMMGTLKTLGQIVAFLSKGPDAAAEHSSHATPETGLASAVALDSADAVEDWKASVGRFEVSLDASPLVTEGPLHIASQKPIVVSEDADGLSAAIVDALNQRGVAAELLSRKGIALLLESPDQSIDAGGLVIVSNSGSNGEAPDDTFLKNAFLAAKRYAPSLIQTAQSGGALFATVARLDGAFGFSGRPLACPAAGGLAGLLKTASLEWAGVACRALDVDPEWNDLPAAAEKIVDELVFAGQTGALEIGLGPDHRYVLESRPSPHPVVNEGRLDLEKGEVVVVSGGARGVTAAAATALAQKIPLTMVLIGRSPAPRKEPTWLAGLSRPADMKRAILENEFNNNGASPREIESSFQAFQANREIQKTLDALKQMGADAHYCSADIRDSKTIESLLQDIRREFGPIRALIHGAGVIDDRLIVDKTPDQFSRVYDTKVNGLRSLLNATREDRLKYLVLFSSVAARFGNVGQVDYAVANEVINKMARQESLTRKYCRVVSINWGPWDGGMVTPSLKREFLKNNVALIPMDAGAQCMLAEMAARGPHPVEIVLGSGPLQPSANTPTTVAPRPSEPPPAKDRMSLLFKREIDTADYPILDHHRLDGKPVVPFAIITEWFGHGALHENPGLALHGIDDMRILKGVKLEKSKKMIRLFAGKATRKGGLYEVPVELRDGVLEGVDVIHSRAKAILTDSIPEPPLFEISKIHPNGGYPRSMEEVYDKILFHGTQLRGIQEIITCSSSGMAAKISSAPMPDQWIKEPLRTSWISDPLALDCAFQMATVWCYEETGSVSLPSYCKEYRQYCRKFPEAGITAVLEVTDLTDHKMTGNFTLLSSDHRVVARLSGYEAVIDPSLYKAFKPHLA